MFDEVKFYDDIELPKLVRQLYAIYFKTKLKPNLIQATPKAKIQEFYSIKYYYNNNYTLLYFYFKTDTFINSGHNQFYSISELNVDNWNDNSEAKSEAKRPRPLRGFQVDFSLTRNVSYAVR